MAKGADCKSAGLRLRRFESYLSHHASPYGLRVAQPRKAVRAERARRSWSEAEAKTGGRMWCVYILRSINHPDEEYTGATADLRRRLIEHDAGKSTHTAKFAPWELKWYAAFPDKLRALEFEKYLKSHSGRAFAKKRLT